MALPDLTNIEWHLFIDDVGQSGVINMAVDYDLLQRAQRGQAFLRLYRWQPACLSFGRNEAARKRYDREKIRTLQLSTVRRPTGGRAVWHEHEVTYAVAAPVDTFGSLTTTYLAIHTMLARALRRLGASVEHADPERGAGTLLDGACFASAVGGEILNRGRKLVGSAQLREGKAFLQHGSILLNGGQDIVSLIARNTHGPTHATHLAAALGRSVEFPEVSDAVTRQAREDWGGRWRTPVSSPRPVSCFSFDDSAWTWRR